MKQGRVLAIVSLVCAFYLSIALVILGLDKFYYVLAGGRKFPTFANLFDQLSVGLSYLALELLYLGWVLRTKVLYLFPRFTSLPKWIVIFLVLAFISYPLGDDVYLYLHAGLMNLNEVNPFLTRAKAFTSELSLFVDWGQTSTYGPLSQLLFTLSAAFVPINPILAIYVYKAFCLGLHVLNGYLIWRLLPMQQRGKITIAYLLNPLLLMEQVGSGHIDVLVSTCTIVLIGCLTTKRYVLGFISLWGGFLAKTLPIIWMPLVGIYLVRQRRWQAIAGITVFSLTLVIALCLTVLPGFHTWASLLNPGVAGQYQSSIAALVRSWLNIFRIFFPDAMSSVQQNLLLVKLSHYLLISFFGFYGWLALRVYTKRQYDELNLVEDIGWATLVLMLVATSWLMPWYASVLFAIAALIPQAQLFGLTCFAFGLSSSAQYVLLGHNSLKSIVAFGVPIVVWLVATKFFKPQATTLPEASTVQS